MATWNLRLATPPADNRQRELWLQHAAGFILFEDARAQGLSTIPDSASESERATATAAVDAAIYGLMELIDGVTGGLRNDEWAVAVGCLGYHRWREGDFGDTPIMAR